MQTCCSALYGASLFGYSESLVLGLSILDPYKDARFSHGKVTFQTTLELDFRSQGADFEFMNDMGQDTSQHEHGNASSSG